MYLRPRVNRFIAGRRIYQREDVSIAFIAKKQFSDQGEEAIMFLGFDGDATIDSVHDRIFKNVSEVRNGKTDNSTDFIEKLAKLPRWILRVVMGILLFLDYFGKVPYSLVKEDPDYASIYISNLGSIKLNAGYHHLNNWGTNSMFCVIGEKYKAPFYDNIGNVQIREALNIGITLDERIADGYYYAKTIKLLKYLLQNPELLEIPAKEEVSYES